MLQDTSVSELDLISYHCAYGYYSRASAVHCVSSSALLSNGLVVQKHKGILNHIVAFVFKWMWSSVTYLGLLGFWTLTTQTFGKLICFRPQVRG
jgi:hypothetical protein